MSEKEKKLEKKLKEWNEREIAKGLVDIKISGTGTKVSRMEAYREMLQALSAQTIPDYKLY